MNITTKVLSMLGFRSNTDEKPAGSRDVISRDVSHAVQRNEIASVRARQALEEALNRNDKLHRDQ